MITFTWGNLPTLKAEMLGTVPGGSVLLEADAVPFDLANATACVDALASRAKCLEGQAKEKYPEASKWQRRLSLAVPWMTQPTFIGTWTPDSP